MSLKLKCTYGDGHTNTLSGSYHVTVYCKGVEAGGCATKKAAPIKVVIRLSPKKSGKQPLVFLSDTILLRGIGVELPLWTLNSFSFFFENTLSC